METIGYAGESGNTWVFKVPVEQPNKTRIDHNENSHYEVQKYMGEVLAARREVIAYVREHGWVI